MKQSRNLTTLKVVKRKKNSAGNSLKIVVKKNKLFEDFKPKGYTDQVIGLINFLSGELT
jgi:hypothetical protein